MLVDIYIDLKENIVFRVREYTEKNHLWHVTKIEIVILLHQLSFRSESVHAPSK